MVKREGRCAIAAPDLVLERGERCGDRRARCQHGNQHRIEREASPMLAIDVLHVFSVNVPGSASGKRQ